MSFYRVCISIVLGLLLAQQSVLAAYPQNPLLLGDSIYVSQQGVYKFKVGQEKPLWSSLGGIETFEPVTHGDLLLVGSTQGLYALEQNSGDIAWHIEKRRTIFTPSIARHAFAGSLHGELLAIEPQTGQIVWRSQFPGWIYSPVFNIASNQLWSAGQAHSLYALSMSNGTSREEIQIPQEAVYSPVDLGNDQLALNLFDGSTLVITASSAMFKLLEGNSQPTDLRHDKDRIYRSHRNGTLSAFDRNSHELVWRKPFTEQDLAMHPSQPGFLLLSDRDRQLILLELEQHTIVCRLQPEGQWALPLQNAAGKINYFRKSMQPPGMSLVQPKAKCK